MKKIIAFVLSLTLIITSFSAIPLYAASIKVSEEAKALATIGMLEGDGGGVTSEYMAKRMDRFTAAISILKLNGLYEESLDYMGRTNFSDVNDVKWNEGKNILAYLKANPDLGFIGNEWGEFLPYKSIGEKEYYKVLLETLGYKQKTDGRSGDFAWDETFDFAESKGLKPSYKSDFNIDLLAKATVSALNTKTKTGKVYINVLIDKGVIKRSDAVYAGLIREEIDIKVKSVRAVGNTIVEVEYDSYISAYDAENVNNYTIDGLTVKDAFYIGDNTVRLETSAQSGGRLYTLAAGKTKIKFAGVSKVSGSPTMKVIKSEDIETVVIEFDKELDYYSATKTSNYSIANVDVNEAEIKGKKVTLSTNGLESRKQYTLKVTNMKSIDGIVSKSQSKTFYSRPDTNPPTVKDVKAETNERVVVSFSEAVSANSAEDTSNYTINGRDGELAIYEAILFGDDEDKVELITETQKASAKYEIIIENIADQTKAGNVMKRPAKKTFNGAREDRNPPQISKSDLKVLSRNHIQLVFTDSSRLDEGTVLDTGNYEITVNDRYKDEIYVENVEKSSYEDGKYKLVLEVEDLSMNVNYTLKVYDIADEFGNVLEKNNTISFTVKRDDFAASTVRDYKVVKGDEIEIFFTKPLDKETAEDIANYEINNSIGHPSKAVYKNDKVTLSTGLMTEGKVYKLTIDGLRDLAENRLKLTFEFKATDGENDTTAPSLDYIYTENKKVVSVVFDEPVRYTDSGGNRTALYLKSSGGKEIILYAKALSDDDRVIEFSGNGVSVPGYNTIYTINKDKSLKGITDWSTRRNAFNTNDLKYYDLTLYGSDEEPDAPEVDYITQIDGKTFEVEMSKEVVIKKSTVSASPSGSFSVVLTDEKNIVNFIISSTKGIDGSRDYKINLKEVLEDRHGVAAVNYDNGYTIFYGEYTDDDKPYIVDVKALDRFTVEIEYNESISSSSPGKYTVKNTDDSARYKTFTTSSTKVDKNLVQLTLNNPLEGRYEYYLIIDTPAKDLVGNTSEDVKGDEFYFEGTDLAPVLVKDVDHEEASAAVARLENVVMDLDSEQKIINANAILVNVQNIINQLNDSEMRNALNTRKAAAAKKIENAENKLAASSVITKISGIFSQSGFYVREFVEAAREAYDALTEAQKEFVTNYEKLINAESKLAIVAVIEKINSLPEASKIKIEDESAIVAARKAYDALTNAEKVFVTNFGKLNNAEAKIRELTEELERIELERMQLEKDKQAANEVSNRIERLNLSEITLEQKDRIASIRENYNVLTNVQKGFVTNYRKLEEAENKIERLAAEQKRIEEENRLREEEEKRQREEEQKKYEAYVKAIEALEAATENVVNKTSALLLKIDEMANALNSYLTYSAPIEIIDVNALKNTAVSVENKAKATIIAALEAAKEAEAAIEAVPSAATLANDVYERFSNREEKTVLLGRINAAKAIVEDKSKILSDAKDKIVDAKVKMAKKWLTDSSFKFSEKAKADSVTPIILQLPAHGAGAIYSFAEIGKMTDGRFIKENTNINNLNRSFKYNINSSGIAKLEFIDEVKDGKTIRSGIKVNRGTEDAVITLKVGITSGNKNDYKLFNINIPAELASPVTITEAAEKVNVQNNIFRLNR